MGADGVDGKRRSRIEPLVHLLEKGHFKTCIMDHRRANGRTVVLLDGLACGYQCLPDRNGWGCIDHLLLGNPGQSADVAGQRKVVRLLDQVDVRFRQGPMDDVARPNGHPPDFNQMMVICLTSGGLTVDHQNLHLVQRAIHW